MHAVREWVSKERALLVALVSTVLAVIVFQSINPFFLSPHGRTTLVYASGYFLIAATGLTFVILTGSFDFSVVALLKLAALLCALYLNVFGRWVVLLAVGICALFGLANGLITSKLRVPSFLATLAMSVLVEGIVLYISRGYLHVVRDPSFRALAVRFVGGLPMVFYWAIGVWLVAVIVARYTAFGRQLYAVGGNGLAAELVGIDEQWIRTAAFVVSGALAGLAGVLYMAQFGGGSIELGSDMMIPLFASVVAGGTSLSGGIGGPQRTLLGVIVVTWIQAGLSMLGIARDLQLVVFALIGITMSALTVERWRGVAVR